MDKNEMNQVHSSKSYEADVVVVGFGGAGASAAIMAADAGARVLILEKQPEGGGNTRLSAGAIRTFGDTGKATAYIEFLCEGSTDSDIIRTLVTESHAMAEWLRGLGGTVQTDSLRTDVKSYPLYHAGAVFPSHPGADGVGPRMRVQGSNTANGRDLWQLLAANVACRKIPIVYGASAERILREGSGEVRSVIAQHEETEISITVRKGLVLACGGYECDHSMQVQYLGQRYYTLGGPAHTGGGVRMAAELGADLWHMNAVASGLGYKVPEFDCAIIHAMPAAGFIYVDCRGLRFVDEGGMDAHAVGSLIHDVDLKTLRRSRVPCYVVFDERTRLAGPVASTERGFISGLYQWSADNSAEINKGWLTTCNSVDGLAQKVGLKTLEQSVSDYNAACREGYDAAFGRSRETLVPILTPPFYAAALWPSLFNTQGGPRRNSRAQVLDVWGKPIPRLYSAGELGSLWGPHYPGAGNLTEALVFGRIAGRNAAAERPRP